MTVAVSVAIHEDTVYHQTQQRRKSLLVQVSLNKLPGVDCHLEDRSIENTGRAKVIRKGYQANHHASSGMTTSMPASYLVTELLTWYHQPRRRPATNTQAVANKDASIAPMIPLEDSLNSHHTGPTLASWVLRSAQKNNHQPGGRKEDRANSPLLFLHSLKELNLRTLVASTPAPSATLLARQLEVAVQCGFLGTKKTEA